jgi:hypothetical protein
MAFLHAPPDNGTIFIYEDRGGVVNDYIAAAHRYRDEKRRVEIRGYCASACLLALSVPGVCVSRAATVKAHHAFEQYTLKIRPDITVRMLNELPVKIRVRLESKIREKFTPESTLLFDDLRQLGVADCDKRFYARSPLR